MVLLYSSLKKGSFEFFLLQLLPSMHIEMSLFHWNNEEYVYEFSQNCHHMWGRQILWFCPKNIHLVSEKFFFSWITHSQCVDWPMLAPGKRMLTWSNLAILYTIKWFCKVNHWVKREKVFWKIYMDFFSLCRLFSEAAVCSISLCDLETYCQALKITARFGKVKR